MRTYLSLAQGLYFVITGLWPIVSVSTFQMVTGDGPPARQNRRGAGGRERRRAHHAGLRQQKTPEVLLLAVGSAAGLIIIDLFYVAKGRMTAGVAPRRSRGGNSNHRLGASSVTLRAITREFYR